MKKTIIISLLLTSMMGGYAKDNKGTPHIAESKTLVGFWRLVQPLENENGNTDMVLTQNYKVINADKTFYTFIILNPMQKGVGLYGTYTITSDSTYTENVNLSNDRAVYDNSENKVRYKLIDENTLQIKYLNKGHWIPELWKRVELKSPAQKNEAKGSRLAPLAFSK